MEIKRELLSKLEEFIDSFETEYGNIEGFEVRLEHPPTGDQSDPATIKSFVIYHIQKTEIKI